MMAFKYAMENEVYEDLASGRVLYNQRGASAFPIRLASEIFLRCLTILDDSDDHKAYTLFDPLCGGAYLLTALGFLHADKINMIYASDIDINAVSLASKNLSLLQPEGLDERIVQIKEMMDLYGKPSHNEALDSALRLRKRMEQVQNNIKATCFAADATGINPFTSIKYPVDIVITDLPYGNLVQWSGSQETQKGWEVIQNTAVFALLDNLSDILESKSVVAIVSQDKLKIEHNDFAKVSRFKHGKRHIVFLRRYTGN